jgi:hypothetical protein
MSCSQCLVGWRRWTRTNDVFHFNIADLPGASFYSIEVGRRGAANYSAADLASKGWTVALTLGG